MSWRLGRVAAMSAAVLIETRQELTDMVVLLELLKTILLTVRTNVGHAATLTI